MGGSKRWLTNDCGFSLTKWTKWRGLPDRDGRGLSAQLELESDSDIIWSVDS